MNIEENSNAVSQKITSEISTNNTQTNENLHWLKEQMHSMFFTLNRAEIVALSLLTSNLHKMDYHKRLLLVDKPEITMLAQVNKRGSLYESIQELSDKEISYSEVTTSSSALPHTQNHLEVLRIDYARKRDHEVTELLQTVTVSDDILKNINAILTRSFQDFDLSRTSELLKILLVNNPQYVRFSPIKRIARLLNLYAETERYDGIHLDLETIDDETETGEYRILLGTSNPPITGYLLQLMEVFNRMGVSVRRSYSLTLSNGLYPIFLSTFYVRLRDNTEIVKDSKFYRDLQRELYNTQILSASSRSYRSLVKPRVTTGEDATVIDAMISFCHTNLSHNNPDSFANDGIMRAFHNHPDITMQLIKLFHLRFDPNQENRDAVYAECLEETINGIENFNSGRKNLDKYRRTIFHCGLLFVQHTLKTNFFVAEKHALSFRIDPAYLEELDDKFTEDLPIDRPFRITFFYGRDGIAYHIGFSDIARGGWRTVITEGRDNYVTSANTVFKENYVLAHTQHLKNKDIYEGGSKMVALLRVSSKLDAESKQQLLYKLQMAFINAFFDLFVTENGSASDPRVIDYYAQDEPIELGPDENMHDVMIELIAKQSVKRGYVLGPGVMSSKQIGINHKDYGVTSVGVIRFAEVTMKALGIDMHKDEFSVKFTGGPNGDVAGNGMRLLLERCPKVKIKLIIDGTGALYDPDGLNHDALKKVILQSDLEAYDVSSLKVGGFLLYRNQTQQDGMKVLYKHLIMEESGANEIWVSNDRFYQIFNSLAFEVEADLFIPAGGRPETIDIDNVGKYFTLSDEPSSKCIVEGANSYITPAARAELQRRGVVIIRDASANKCGVISSSYEIIANLLMSDDEFLSNKDQYVKEVIEILNQMSEREASLILKRYTECSGQISYTDISNDISREINDHYSKIFNFFQLNPELSNKTEYLNAMLLHMPHTIGANSQFKDRVKDMPEKVKYAILASKLASAIVYEGDTSSMYAGMIEMQVNKFQQFS